jgi:hypothetical protein
MLQHGDILAAPLHCDGKELMPFAPAAFNTPFGRLSFLHRKALIQKVVLRIGFKYGPLSLPPAAAPKLTPKKGHNS